MYRPHHLFFFFNKNKELNELYISTTLRGLAVSIVSVFVPIYLFKLEYSIPAIMIFYASIYIIKLISVIPVAKLVARYGSKHSILFSAVPLIIFLVMLRTLDVYFWPLWILAIMGSISNTLFWMGYHTDFAEISHKKSRGKEVGVMELLVSFFTVLGPLFGGFIAAVFGFHSLFVVASIVLVISTIPLFLSKDIHEPFDFSFRQIFKDQKKKEFFGIMGISIEEAVGLVIWPLFLFQFILKGVDSIGIVTSLSLTFSLIATIVVSGLSDIKRKLIYQISSLANFIIWVVRIFIKTPIQVYLTDSFYGIFRSMKKIPLNALSYDKARRGNVLEFTIFREAIISLGKATAFILMAVFASYIAEFAISAGSSLLYIIF